MPAYADANGDAQVQNRDSGIGIPGGLGSRRGIARAVDRRIGVAGEWGPGTPRLFIN